MKCLYSIIIPHFNDFEALRKLVQSIPIRADIEIVVIDDNSTTFPDILAFPDRDIQILLNVSGTQSAGACRNIGLKVAKGRWLLFADSDDFFTANAFDILDKSSDCKCDIIYFSPASIDLRTGLTSDRHIQYKKLVRGFLLSKTNTINYYFYVPWSKLILNSFIKKHSIKFDEVLASNDVMFSLQAGLNAKHIKAIDKEIYCVTKREGSLTSRLSSEVIRCRYEVSLRRNHVLLQSGLKVHQDSVYSLFKYYRDVINVTDVLGLCKMYLMGRVIFFPIKFRMYLMSPYLLYKRLLR